MGGAEAFGGAGDEDEGDVGEFLAEGRELGEEVAAYAAGSWGMSDCCRECFCWHSNETSTDTGI